MLLLAMCLTTNALFCSTLNSHELSAKTTVIETFPENIIANGDGDNTTYLKASFFNNNNSNNETIKKNICTIPMIKAISKGISQLLFLIIVLLSFCFTFFLLLHDEWTLINQKVRLDY